MHARSNFVISHGLNDDHNTRIVIQAVDYGAWGLTANVTLYRKEIKLYHCEEEEFTPKQKIFQDAPKKSKILHGRREFRNRDKWNHTYFSFIVQAILDKLSLKEGSEEGEPLCALHWDDEPAGSVFVPLTQLQTA